jgi:acyl-coenzyme A synthetase/AMP-(fatty) acid ligase
MFSFKTHLNLIEDVVNRKPQAVAFKLPRLHPDTGKIDEWTSVSYQQFRDDINVQASYWIQSLKAKNIAPGSVVTLWLRGLTYEDSTLIFGLSRAGYILQLVSFSFSNPEAVYDMAQRSESKLLIYDSVLKEVASKLACPIPMHLYDISEHQRTLRDDASLRSQDLPDLLTLSSDPDGYGFILHTSGSTSGKPKLVSWRNEWLDYNTGKLVRTSLPSYEAETGTQDVYAWLGTMCHAAQLFEFLGVFLMGSCVVQPTSLAFPSSELLDMVTCCGLNGLPQFPPLFSAHLAASRRDPAVLKALQGLNSVVLIGMPLGKEDLDWCAKTGIKLKLVFASTECGTVMYSVPEKSINTYKPVETSSLKFMPVQNQDQDQGSESGTSKLVELVVCSDSKDCPHKSFRSPEDGHFHTGDLFEEVEPGYYESRGRGDDWIKLLSAGRCDTRAIESNAIHTCKDIIHDCVATGYHRPSVVLFVEVGANSDLQEDELKNEILRRIGPAQAKMWDYEKIVDARQIVVVPAGSLPRTGVKGNIRRKAVEEIFKERLDRVYEGMK